MADEDKINSYVDRQGFSSDTKYVLEELNKVLTEFNKLKEIKLGFGKVDGMASFNATSEKAATSITNMKQAADELSKTSKALADQQQKNASIQKQLDKALAEGKVERQKYNAELKKEIELQNASNGSIEQARALIKNLTSERNKLDLTTENGAKRLAELNSEIDKQNEFIRVNSDLLAKQKINIGNYPDSAKIIVDALSEIEKKIGSLQEKQQQLQNFSSSNPIGFKIGGHDEELKQVSAELKDAKFQFDALNNITTDIKFLKLAASAGDARKEIGFMVGRLNELETAGLRDTKVYADLEKKVAELKDQVEDTNARLKALSSDTRGVDLFVSSVSFAAEAFRTASGAAVLFGASEKEVAEQIKILIAVQNVATGIQNVANQLTTDGTTANKIYAFSQKQLKIAFDASATSAARFKAAMISTGIGALIVGVGLLITNFGKLKDFLMGTTREAQRLAEAKKRLEEFNKDVSASIVKEGVQLDILRAKIEDTNISMDARIANVKDLQELYPQYFKNLKQEDILNGNAAAAYNLATEAILRRAKAMSASKKIEELTSKELDIEKAMADDRKLTNERIKNAYQRVAYEGKAETMVVKATKEEVQREIEDGFNDREKIRQKDLAAIKKEKDFYIETITKNTDITTEQYKREQDEKKKAEEEKKKLAEKAAEEAKKRAEASAAAQNEIDQLQLKYKEDFYKKIAEDESFSYDERLGALELYYSYRNKIIERAAKYEKSKAGLTSAEIELIEKKRLDSLTKSRNDYYADSIKINEQKYKKEIDQLKELSDEEQAIVDANNNAIINKVFSVIDQEIEKRKQLQDLKKKYAEEDRELYKQLYDEIAQTVTEIFTAADDREIERLKKRSEQIDATAAKEIETVNQTVTNKDQAANEIAIIEARSTAQKEQLAAQEREIEKKKANTERLANIAQIAGNIAQGVTSLTIKAAEAKAQAALLLANPLTAPYAPVALTQAALITSQIPIVVGIQAAQLARLIIPRFFMGKGEGNNYEGPAWVDDGGKPEAIIREGGGVEIGTSKPRITWIGKNDIVLPDARQLAFDMAINKSMPVYQSSNDTYQQQDVVGELKDMKKVFVSAIKKIPQPIIKSESPLKIRIRNNGSDDTYLNNNLQSN